MTQLIILCLAAFLTSLLTFFSGFGLGTILMPVFAIFFPLEIAIALTGVVHFLNNAFKLSLVGMKADKQMLIKFGIPAFIAAFAGAWVLIQLADLRPLYEYYIGERVCTITLLKIIVSLLLIFFAIIEVVPFLRDIKMSKEKLVVGGILSGFFGGLSGHQGALRSAFLIKSELSKEAYVATGIVIACLVDLSRLGVYVSRFSEADLDDSIVLVIAATVSAFIGAFAGNKLLKQVTLKTIQRIVTVMIFTLALALGFGLV